MLQVRQRTFFTSPLQKHIHTAFALRPEIPEVLSILKALEAPRESPCCRENGCGKGGLGYAKVLWELADTNYIIVIPLLRPARIGMMNFKNTHCHGKFEYPRT